MALADRVRLDLIAVFLSTSSSALLAQSEGSAAAAPSQAGAGAASWLETATEAGREVIVRRMLEGVPALSVAVAVDGELVWSEAFGLADVASDTPASTATRFRIGSTSKSVTAAAMARLLERGVVDLDADIREAFPLFPEKAHPITLRQLLSNQSGIRHYRGAEALNRRHYASVAEGLAIFADDPLLFEPGTAMQYSSYGFNLAGAVLAHAAEQRFDELIEAEVFRPLGMEASCVDDPTLEIPERASFYSRDADALRAAFEVDDSYKAPSGGLLSTPTDMVRFGAALVSRRTSAGEPWLRADTVELLFTPRATADGQSTGYALGFRVQEADPAAHPPAPYAVHHGGSSIGGRSMLLILPDDGIVLSLMANTDAYRTKEVDAAEIARAFTTARSEGE